MRTKETGRFRTLLAIILVFALSAMTGIANASGALEDNLLPDEETAQIAVESNYLSHTDEASGRTFVVTTESTSPKVLLAGVDMVTLEPAFVEIEFHGGGNSAELVTVNGLLASTEYYLYRDELENSQVLMSDAGGAVTFYQDADADHMVLLQAVPSTIYIRDNATGGACTLYGTWDAGSKTCYLTSDLSDTVQINAPGLTLDCLEGSTKHSVTNPGGLTNAIYVPAGRDNVTVRNCVVSGFVRAVYSRADSTTIEDNEIDAMSGQGIYLNGSADSQLNRNVVDNIGGIGVYINNGSDNTTLTLNQVTNCGAHGIYARLSNNVDMFSNTVADIVNYGILYNGVPNSESSDNVVNNASTGLGLLNRSDHHISHRDELNMDTGWYSDWYGVTGLYIFNSSYVEAYDYRATDTAPDDYRYLSTGVYMGGNALSSTEAAFNQVHNAVVDGMGYGLYFSQFVSHDNQVFGGRFFTSRQRKESPYHDPSYSSASLIFNAEATNNTVSGAEFNGPNYAIATNHLGAGNRVYDCVFTYGDGALSGDYGHTWYVPGSEVILLDDNAGTGNTWLSNGDGYSEICLDEDLNGICDTPFVLDPGVTDSTDNYPVAVNPHVGDVEVDVQSSETMTASATLNSNGTTTVNLTEVGTTQLNTFSVTFPAGTLAPAGQDVIDLVTVGGNRPGVVINAVLPAGTAKDVSLSRGVSRLVCIDDTSDAEFSTSPGGCDGDRFDLPADGTCVTVSVNGDPSDGLHNVELCVSADGLTVSLSGLLHTAVYLIGDEDEDGVADEMDDCPGTDLNGPIPTQTLREGHLGDSTVNEMGCNASQILACKGGQNNGPERFGVNEGLLHVFELGIGWAQNCW